jgi:hypothetical protein
VETTETELPALLTAAAGHRFDLSSETPLRATLFELDGDTHILLLLTHHIAVDGWSMAPLMRDLKTAYTARLTGSAPQWRPLPVRYADFAHWQRELLVATAHEAVGPLERQTAFWPAPPRNCRSPPAAPGPPSPADAATGPA